MVDLSTKRSLIRVCSFPMKAFTHPRISCMTELYGGCMEVDSLDRSTVIYTVTVQNVCGNALPPAPQCGASGGFRILHSTARSTRRRPSRRAVSGELRPRWCPSGCCLQSLWYNSRSRRRLSDSVRQAQFGRSLGRDCGNCTVLGTVRYSISERPRNSRSGEGWTK